MDFYVYDNIYTYNKREEYNGVPNTRLICDTIDIPENHSFWFHTDMEMKRNNVNLNTRYVHIHNGVGTTNQPKFDKEPLHVTRSNIKYNPKEKRIEIGGGMFKKPVFAKKCIYYGANLPVKKMNVLGEWYYNFSNNSMIFILDYMTEKIKFHWEDIPDEPTIAELRTKEARLELEVEEMEKKIESQKPSIAQRNFGLVSDLS